MILDIREDGQVCTIYSFCINLTRIVIAGMDLLRDLGILMWLK